MKTATPINTSFPIFNLAWKKIIFLAWKLKMWTEKWGLVLGKDGCWKKQRRILCVTHRRSAVFWDLDFYNFLSLLRTPSPFEAFLSKCITGNWEKKKATQLNSEFNNFFLFFFSPVCPGEKKKKEELRSRVFLALALITELCTVASSDCKVWLVRNFFTGKEIM